MDIETAKKVFNIIYNKSYLTKEEESMLIDAEDILLENDLMDENENLIEEE
jgi:hypothetical protein